MSPDHILALAGDVLCLLGFGVALAFFAATPSDERNLPRAAKLALCAATGLYAFAGFANVLDATGVTPHLDAYEDYAEMLFMPMTAFALSAVGSARRLDAVRRAGEAIQSEHDLLTAVVDTTPSAVLVVAADGTPVYANEPARALFGISDDPATTALRIPEGVQIGGQRTDWAPAREALADMAAGAPLRDAVRFVMVSDATTHAVTVSSNPLGSSGGSAVLAIQDITDQMRHQQDLERTVSTRTAELVALNRELGTANDAKREFLAKMSHELRTPLNSVIGFTGIMIDGLSGPLSEEQLRQLTMVRRAGRQLLEIVDDVLDISRIESGKAALVVSSADVAEVVHEAVEAMRQDVEERPLTLSTEIADGLGAIRTDRGKLGQVLRNLISNAVKFTDAGGRVTVRAERDGDGIVFSVSDTGAGIPEDALSRVFEPFVQIDTPEHMKPQGAGLGLAVSRDLVTLMGGTIAVESTLGEGSTFTVRLPLSPA